MIITEFYATREDDNVNLYYTYSDLGMKIQQVDTGIIYDDAIDVEGTPHTYIETAYPIEDDISAEEALGILLGGGSNESQENT